MDNKKDKIQKTKTSMKTIKINIKNKTHISNSYRNSPQNLEIIFRIKCYEF